jgi:regulatory protein
MSYHKADNIKNKSEKTNTDYKMDKPYGKCRKKAPKKITASYLHNSGLYYLERFAASKAHFKDVMLRKVKRSCMHHKDQDYDVCEKMVDELANKFEACGLLNDKIYANALAESMRRKGLSKRVIQIKMHNKGLSPDHAIQVLEQLDMQSFGTFEDAEFAAALKLSRKKKIGPYSALKEQDAQKSLGILARAGYSYDIARRIIDMDPEALNEI